MDRESILRIFRMFYGSSKWASDKTGVKKTTISQWLHGTRNDGRLAEQLPKLAAELVRTNGKCMGRDVNGESVRSKVARMRSARKGKK